MKNRKKFVFLILATSFILSGCATRFIPLEPGAENVKVMDTTTYPIVLPPLTCQYKGQILGSDITPFQRKDTSFTESEMNLIKNNTLLLNGNFAVIRKNAIAAEGNYYNHISVSDVFECYPYPQGTIPPLQ